MENVTNASTAAQQQGVPKKPSLIIYYFGNGKGKTTAALGLALRASAYKKRILFAQFVKGDWKTGEDQALSKMDHLDHKKFGLGFVYKTDSAARMNTHKAAAKTGLNFICDNFGNYDIIVMDEISNAIELGLVKAVDVINIINRIKDGRTLVLTGSARIHELVSCSNLVTQMKKISHPFDKGVMAIESIDW